MDGIIGIDTITILIDQLRGMAAGFIATLPQLAIALVVIVITWLVSRLARRIAERLVGAADLRPALQQLVETLVGILVWVVGLMVAATVVLPGLTPASIIAGLGIGTVAIGFAFQDIFENFLAGVLIMMRKVMRIGDLVECEGVLGRVEHITLRETHLRKPSGELTIMPNSMLFKNPVEIFTDRDIRRHEVVVGVGYEEDADAARKAIEAAVRGIPELVQDKPVEVFAREFNASSVDFTVRWWAGSQPVDVHASRDLVIRAVKRALDDAGIELPYPYVTATFKQPLPVRIDLPASGEAEAAGELDASGELDKETTR